MTVLVWAACLCRATVYKIQTAAKKITFEVVLSYLEIRACLKQIKASDTGIIQCFREKKDPGSATESDYYESSATELRLV